MKLWDKGYDIDRFTEEFTIGKDRELDVMLAKADVLGNMAHLKMLHHIGLISDGELKDLAQGLKDIFAEIEQGKFHIEAGIEDIHSQIECLLTRKCGEAGKKIHTGRSRNDQVLTGDLLVSFAYGKGRSQQRYSDAGVYPSANRYAFFIRHVV